MQDKKISDKYEILTPSGWQKFDGVRRLKKDVVEIHHTHGIIRASIDHKFIIDGREILASALKPRDKLSNNNSVVCVSLKSSELVYDVLNVSGGSHYLHDGDIVSHNCFLGSSMTLLTGSTLARLTHEIPIKEYTDQYKGMKVYALPKQGHMYSMAVDVSRGRHLDYSAFVIYDITQYPHTIVATYRNNEIPPLLYASLIQKVGISYNMAYILIEINDIGGQIADILWNELEYENMHWTKAGDQLGKTGSDPYPGVRTTKKTKRIGCANLKDMIDNNQLLINDYDFIHELSTFVQSKTGSYEADEGFNDDVVMCGVLHAWLVSQRYFNELTDSDLRNTMHNNHMKELEDQIMMVGFSTDGVDEMVMSEVREEIENRYGFNSW